MALRQLGAQGGRLTAFKLPFGGNFRCTAQLRQVQALLVLFKVRTQVSYRASQLQKLRWPGRVGRSFLRGDDRRVRGHAFKHLPVAKVNQHFKLASPEQQAAQRLA